MATLASCDGGAGCLLIVMKRAVYESILPRGEMSDALCPSGANMGDGVFWSSADPGEDLFCDGSQYEWVMRSGAVLAVRAAVDMLGAGGRASGRRALILRTLFGVGEFFPEKTLEATGNLFGVSKGRIGKICLVAIRQLRHPSRAGRLKGFL